VLTQVDEVAGISKSIIFFYEKRDPSPTQHTAVDTISDAGGRRLAVYEYPYRDGSGIADLGRKPEKYTFNIKFHGLNYQETFEEFIDVVVNYSGQLALLHPVRSSDPKQSLVVRFQDYEFLHRHDEWNAVTIRATFMEDQTDQILSTNAPAASPNSQLRKTLQNLVNYQAAISADISAASALLLLPGAIVAAAQARLNSIVGQVSRLMGQLGATFASSQTIQQVAQQGSLLAGGVAELNAGATVSGTLPAVFQVGYDPTTQAQIQSQLANYVSANQVTPQQATYSANQARAAISAAIVDLTATLGNQGFSSIVQYRSMANDIQATVEACLTSVQSLIKMYTLQSDMSLRGVAFANGLSPDEQNAILALNPEITSVNFIPKGTVLVVPA
jgi:prophage DNA circulation protein